MNHRVRVAIALARLVLAAQMAAQTITEFPIPTIPSYAHEIAGGPDGNLWFVEADKIGRISTAGVITEFAIPTADSGPDRIRTGPDGSVWFTETNAGKIGRITPSGVVTEFPIPTTNSQPEGIAADVNGNLWFTEALADKIGRITPAGFITEFQIPKATSQSPDLVGPLTSAPGSIASGTDGNMWFTENYGNKIARITAAGVITEFPIPTAGSGPYIIAAGPDGSMWFTEEYGNNIGRITPSGFITEFSLPAAGTPLGIAAGPDGNLWFTEFDANKIGRITASGVVTEFTIPTANPRSEGIAAGPDGNLWFTEWNAIGRITTPACNDAMVPCIGSGQEALDVSSDVAGKTHLLYGGAGSFSTTTLDASGLWTTVTAGFNRPTGFDATAIADGPDGRSCILWQNADGRGYLEIFGPPFGHATSNFSSPSGWTPLDLSIGPQIHLLWTNGNGQMRITIHKLLSMTEGPTYGPYPGWSAGAMADGPDGATWVLWRHSDGRAGIARYRDGTFETAFRWSATPGWSAQNIAVGADSRPRVLWTDTDGRMGIGTVDDQGQLFDRKAYTSVGQRARRIAAAPDGLTQVLWTGVNRGGSLWILNSDNSIKSELPTPEPY